MINSATVRLCPIPSPTATDRVGAVAPAIPPATG